MTPFPRCRPRVPLLAFLPSARQRNQVRGSRLPVPCSASCLHLRRIVRKEEEEDEGGPLQAALQEELHGSAGGGGGAVGGAVCLCSSARLTPPPLCLQNLSERPEPNYLSAAAPPSSLPARHFCCVCGCPSHYTCPTCGGRYCSSKCLCTHRETRCFSPPGLCPPGPL